QRSGETHLEATRRHLAASLDADPEFAPSLDLFESLLFAAGDRTLPEIERAILARAVARAAARPHLLVVHARALRTAQRHADALAMLDRAAARGADRSVIALERARTLTGLGDSTAAASEYWRGLTPTTGVGRALYRQDLGWILRDDSLATFDAVPDDSVSVWLVRFWAQRDAAAAEQPGARLRAHLRRWVEAHQYFRVPSPERRNFYTRFWGIAGGTDCIASATALVDSLPLRAPEFPGDQRAHEPLLDHRGWLWIRHGAPVARTTVPSPAADALPEALADLGIVPGDEDRAQSVAIESWVYWVDGRWRAFHLGGSAVFGSHAPTTLRSYLPLSQGPWLALAEILPSYLKAALFLNPDVRRLIPNSCYAEIQTPVATMREDAHVAITTDSDSPRWRRPWNAAIQSFAIGAGTAPSRALVTFAIPARSLLGDTLPDGRLAYRLQFRGVAFRGRDGQRVTWDTTRTFVTRPLAADANLSGLFEWPLPPGTWQLAVRTWQAGDSSGAYALRPALAIPDTAGLALSDLVTGEIGGLPWAGGGMFPLNTRGAYPVGGELQLWFEVYGLAAGTPFRSRFELTPIAGGAKGRAVVSAQEVSDGPVTALRRTLGLADLAPGTYRLAVTVEAGAAVARREQPIVIR
ncbi:MAG TPA: hypothetical protein VFN90_06565, partial [Gemmatimonadales bacterium]|nr:hypothetical protein [Gemmatimonadales bacterium]